MQTISATITFIPRISFLCPYCEEFNSYTRFGEKRPVVLECHCGEVFAPVWRDNVQDETQGTSLLGRKG